MSRIFKKGVKGPIPNGKASNLLKGTLEAYYWVGFLLADGYFIGDRGLALALSRKDEEHLRKFTDFIECPNIRYSVKGGTNCIEMSLRDKEIIPHLVNKFDFRPRKTYNPPRNLAWIRGNRFLAFFAGYIDGDGCIRKGNQDTTFYLVMSGYKTWNKIFSWFETSLHEILGISRFGRGISKVHLDKHGWVWLQFADTRLLREFKKRLLRLNLPLLKRKWDKIDMNFINKYERFEKIRVKIIQMHIRGYSKWDIAKKLKVSWNHVHTTLKNNP